MTHTKETSTETFSFPKAEHDVLAFWEQHQIFQKTLEKTQDKPVYAFYDGPPFATGLPHHGHLLASTLKDIIPRYFTMTGHYVQRRFGWDCHGLPIEYEIDKKLGKPTHEVVAERGIAGYNQECRSIVQRYAAEWHKTITRIGRWIDFDNDYKTMNPSFMESTWWVFKQVWDKGLIYQGTKVVPFSTALGTGLSNFEAGSNYQDVQDPSIIVLIKLIDQARYLTVWTTTPWTLPSNLGVCVNPNIQYLIVNDRERDIELIIAKDRLDNMRQHHTLDIVSECTGHDLEGLAYEPIFPYFKHFEDQGAFRIHCDDYVTTEDGTGLVHMAPGFGEDDHRVLKQAGVDALALPVDNQGCFTEEVPDYQGQYVKDADKAIMKDLKQRGRLFEQSTVVHSYPFCPRSDTPLIYRAIPSWYINVESIKERLLATNNKIHWVPEHIKHGRFGKWLEGARDWAISRNRVWGTPLPLWINDETQQVHCIGSINELEQLSGTPVTDLHRDHVDELTFTKAGESGTYRRIPEVLDCWFESGAMPYAQLHYPFENADYFKQAFPANYIAEGLDQTRGWFYTLTVLSTILFDQPAFRNVIVNGLVMAEDGKKMSKRLQNYTPPNELMEAYGADALRLYLINSGLVRGEEQRFVDHGVKDMTRRTLLPWYNAFKFLHTYTQVDHWDPQQHPQAPTHILDQWIISRLQSLKTLIKQHMNAYQLYNVVPELLLFIEDLTNTYIRLNRARFWAEGLDDDKRSAYTTLYSVIKEFSTCMAPFTPFLSEHIYQQLLKLQQHRSDAVESVHLCDYPEPNPALIDHELERAVIRLQQILLLGRQKRNDLKIKIKTPLRSLTIIHKDQTLLDEIKKLEPIIQKELNIKSIVYHTNENDFITLFAKPNSPVLGKRFGKRFAEFSQQIQQFSHEDILQLEQQGHIELNGETLTVDDILIFREVKPESQAVTNRFITIELDSNLDANLIDEGLAREVVNRIQKSRKELNFNVDDRIDISYQADPRLMAVIKQHQDYICRETLTKSITEVTTPPPHALSFDVDGHSLAISIQRHA